MVKFLFEYKNRKFNIDVEECKTYLSKASGLMFRKKSKPLLFIFSRGTRESIHSFFCVNFIAIWFDNGEIVDVKLVKPWKIYIKPRRKFYKLLEIPENDENFTKLRLLIFK
jgi:uncharacterized membrane protein (UPF0127 family)